MKKKDDRITWVAHRGYPTRYPENTLLGYEAALECGAEYVELDVQLTADGVPVLHHDLSLLRMAGVDEDIVDVHLEDFLTRSASYPERFGDRFSTNHFCSLEHFAKWLCNNSTVTAFVEIKKESVRHFGTSVVLDAVYRAVSAVLDRVVVISFDDIVVERACTRAASRIGWVLPRWASDIERRARELQPAYVFCDRDLLPVDPGDRWEGRWRWVIYNIDDMQAAEAMVAQGMNCLETNRIGEMLNHSNDL